MKKPKLIKYAEMQKDDLPIDADRALADFRAFYEIADVHTKRIKDPSVIEAMREILEKLDKNLLNA